MTIQQLRTAMEAARTGSITQAAKNLYLSQPNASSMLRTLEQELGYEIFSRTNSGIVPTEAGERFLEHAKVILAQLQELYTIRAQGRVCRLRLGVQSFSPAVEAFIRLTQQYRDCPSAEFKCVNISADGGIRALADMELDVVAALIAPCMLPAAEQAVQNQNLELHFLHQVPACLNLRRGHPLLAKLPPNAETFDYRLLEAYPYVEYQKLPTRTDGYTTISTADQVRYRYRIVVDERDTRCRIVGTTDAFSIGCRLPQAVRALPARMCPHPGPEHAPVLHHPPRRPPEPRDRPLPPPPPIRTPRRPNGVSARLQAILSQQQKYTARMA